MERKMDIEMLNVQTIMFENSHTSRCVCCGEGSEFSVILAKGLGTVYLPNQKARTMGLPFNNLKEVWFCKQCIGIIERGINATITRLRDKSGQPPLCDEE
jgi:hypothetical protein